MKRDYHTTYQRLENRFAAYAESHWDHLSRLNNLLIILNISLFLLAEWVTQFGYDDTFYSLLCLSLVAVGPLLAFGLLNRLWYYRMTVLSEVVGIYFLVASVGYWVETYRG